MMGHYTIAIDGPSGAGKSTTAAALAQRLGLAHLDTGAMYRALAAALRADGIDPGSEEQVVAVLDRYHLEMLFTPDGQHTLVNGQDLTDQLYSQENAQAASDVSRYSAVRSYLVAQQRRVAEKESFILDGRDIGTVVLPEADFKFFLTADPEVRAMRRKKDLAAKGEQLSLEEVLLDIQKRDEQDSSRADSPLRQADDALLIDSTNLSLDEVISIMVSKIKGKIGQVYV